MAKKSLAGSAHRRNLNLKNASTNSDNLKNNCSISNDSTFNSSHPFNLLIGLAFAAILAVDRDVEHCKYELAVFLTYRNAILDPSRQKVLRPAIINLLESGISAFKILGFPYYFDDFMLEYQRILNSIDIIPFEMKKEMQRILHSIF